jgi:hypothetical protein
VLQETQYQLETIKEENAKLETKNQQFMKQNKELQKVVEANEKELFNLHQKMGEYPLLSVVLPDICHCSKYAFLTVW